MFGLHKFGVTGIQGGIVQFWVQFVSPLIGGQGLVHLFTLKGCLAFAQRSLGRLSIRNRALSERRSRRHTERSFGRAAIGGVVELKGIAMVRHARRDAESE